VILPAALLASPVYANLRKTHARLVEIVGAPPFTLRLGNKSAAPETFEELRDQALELAKEGLKPRRFKGLGEMDPEELAQTTMDPARRMLIRVEVDDAAAADRIFSILMGDQVEPRREFIEQNAKDVRFLDV
jgi:DNA gyrase subunit B